MRAVLALLFLVAALGAAPRAHADYAAGAAFYAQKDYKRAFAEFLPAADAGDANAQFTLGAMYDVGQHVAVDKWAAAGWYRRAAEQGHPHAQLRLSGMLHAGEGAAPDRVEAYRWALLAIERVPASQQSGARFQANRVRSLIDDAQAARAAREADAWKPTLPTIAPRDRGAPPRLRSVGTGIFINEAGTLITDFHVAWPCRRLLISHGEAVNEASIITFDIALDVAALATPFLPMQSAALRISPPPAMGDPVSLVGYALRETRSRAPTSARGTVTALTDLSGDTDFFRISAPALPGQSGGPVLGAGDEVLGLVKATIKAENDSLAVSAGRIAAFLARAPIPFRASAPAGASEFPAAMIALVECWQ